MKNISIIKISRQILLKSLFAFSLVCSIAHAAEIGRTSKAIGGGGVRFAEHELAMLPDLIEVRTRYYLFERTKKLEKIMAPYKEKYGYGYGTIHHYGVGQIYLNKVYFNPSLKAQRRSYLLRRAISEFGFVLDPDKYPKYSNLFKKTFLPVVLLKRAEAYMLLEQFSKAIPSLQMALKIKPSYYNAYEMMSRCYQSIGDNESAAKILKIGERYKRKK